MQAARPARPDPRILAAWAAKRKRFFLCTGIVISVEALVLIVWTIRPYANPTLGPFAAQVLLFFLSVVTLGAIALFEIYDFHCPACGKTLGLTPWAESCPRCAVRLTEVPGRPNG